MVTDRFVKETYNDFEILATRRTANDGMVRCIVGEDDDGNTSFVFYGTPQSDIIVHIFAGEDGGDEYIHVKSGAVVGVRPFMYTKRYIPCRITRDGFLRASALV